MVALIHVDKVHGCLAGFIQRNVEYEIHKAIALKIMVTALHDWECTILEAAQRAADCTGFSPETIRCWARAFFYSALTCSTEEINEDEHITDALATNRGDPGNFGIDSILRDEDFCLAARSYIRANACIKGQPNMTSIMFMEWIKKEYNIKIHESTACRWLQKLGFSRVHHQKGIYFDGHDRDDVVAYRNKYLNEMSNLDSKSLTCFDDVPQLEVGEKPLIRVTHDECTYYANCDQSYFWADEHTNVLRQKSLGASIMVSDFIDEVNGFLHDDREEARVLLETSKEGYFTHEHLLRQVEKTVDIFERVHPEAKGVFMFDNAPSHRKVADDALNADRMNVGPGGKQPVMRDTVWEGQVQKMVDACGIPKGMKIILEERGIDTRGMKAKDMRELLKSFPDFKRQSTLLETYIQQRGHICIYYPKYHCELNPIERVWCQSKKYTRAYADGTITRLRKIVPEGLNSVTQDQIKKYFATCREYERAYREGVTGRDVEERVKVYKSHRRVNNA